MRTRGHKSLTGRCAEPKWSGVVEREGGREERERERAYVHTSASRIPLSEATIFATSIDPPDRSDLRPMLSVEKNTNRVSRIMRYPVKLARLVLEFSFLSKIGRSDMLRATISYLLASVRGRIHTHIQFDWTESRSEHDL